MCTVAVSDNPPRPFHKNPIKQSTKGYTVHRTIAIRTKQLQRQVYPPTTTIMNSIADAMPEGVLSNIFAPSVVPSGGLISPSSSSPSSSSKSKSKTNKKQSSGGGSKRKRAQKAADAPRRPLSAYNLFFKRERLLIVSGDAATDDSTAASNTGSHTGHRDTSSENIDDNDSDQTTNKTAEGSSPIVLGGSYSGMLSTLGRTVVQPVDGITARRGKRVHRKTHGKMGFATMAKTISSKWKSLDAEARRPYDEQAKVEKARYLEELRKYKERKAAEAKEAEVKAKADEASKMMISAMTMTSAAAAEVVKSATEDLAKKGPAAKKRKVDTGSSSNNVKDKVAAKSKIKKPSSLMNIADTVPTLPPFPTVFPTNTCMTATTPEHTSSPMPTSSLTHAIAPGIVTPGDSPTNSTRDLFVSERMGNESNDTTDIHTRTNDIAMNATHNDAIDADLDSLDNIDDSIWEETANADQLLNILGCSSNGNSSNIKDVHDALTSTKTDVRNLLAALDVPIDPLGHEGGSAAQKNAKQQMNRRNSLFEMAQYDGIADGAGGGGSLFPAATAPSQQQQQYPYLSSYTAQDFQPPPVGPSCSFELSVLSLPTTAAGMDYLNNVYHQQQRQILSNNALLSSMQMTNKK